MQQVSCRTLGILFKAARRRKLADDLLTEGVPYDIEYLRSSKNRIEWSVFCRILRNSRAAFSLQDLSDLNEAFMRSPFFSYVGVIARILFTTHDLYDWINKNQVGGGVQLFGECVRPSFEHVGTTATIVRLEITEGYEASPEFFWMTRGAYVAMPTMVNSSDASVEMTIDPDGKRATYDIRYTNKRRTLSAFFRWVALPFTAHKAARELARTNEELSEKFHQLTAANRELEAYQNNLESLVSQRTVELTLARDQLAGTVTQLEEARGVRERFFGNISHEIRTPLSIVLLAVSDIEKRTKGVLDPRAQAGLHSISDSARKLLRLFDELLLLAAGQEGKLKLSPEAVNLNGLITSLVAAWTPATDEAGLSLVAMLDAVVTAKVDPVAIERVLTNLVSNAVKYTPRGGAIEIAMRQDAAVVQIVVRDNGPGIGDELMGRLFGRFERAEGEHRKITGTGIGLSLVKQLVEQHGGTVAARRRETGGTEMQIELPASLVIAPREVAGPQLRLVDHVKAPTVKQHALVAPPDLAKGSILLAEDDPRLADMIAELLSDEYVVRVANDGASALALAKLHQPQLLITDIDMPVMDGIELSRRFREATNDKLAPIIILSAVLDLGTRVAGLDAGAVDYVTKPFDPAELKARVRAQFRMRDLAVRLHKAEQLSTLGVLTSGLAHELRNPANGVVNAIEPLKMLLPPELLLPGEGVGELVSVIGECAAAIQTLSKQLLGFKDSGSPLELRPAKLRTIVERAAQLVKGALLDRRLEVDVSSDLVVSCAPPLLVQVFTNLLENGAHAAGKGGWIKVTATVAAGRIAIVVSDSGPGVPVGLRDKIFEPFFTTKPQGVGTGLGLPVSREIALRHGGNLELRDSGAASVFVIDLPAAPAGLAVRTA